MVPITIIDNGDVIAPMLLMPVSRNPGIHSPVIRRNNPRNTAIIQGLRKMFLHFVRKSDTVNTASPAVHIKILAGIMNIDAAKRP